MPVEFIGYIGNHNSSEILPRSGPIVDRDYIEAVAKAHELGGFDRALLAFHSWSPDALQIGQHVASVTRRLGVFVAQRPGFTAPTVAARQFATLDQLYPGRFSLNVITGGDSDELAQDGNTLDDKDDRYKRTNEFLDIFRAELTSDTPFDYNGQFFQVKRAFSHVKPPPGRRIDIFVAGASDAAIDVAGRHADVFALWGEPLTAARDLLTRVREASARYGRPAPEFSVSFRPIIAETEDAAWEKAESILAKAKSLQNVTGFKRAGQPVNEGSRRLLAAAAGGSRHDKRLWTGIAELTGAKGNSTALVGTPDQVADAIVDYYDLGIGKILIRGFDPLIDAIEYGRDLLPRVRALVAERDNARRAA